MIKLLLKLLPKRLLSKVFGWIADRKLPRWILQWFIKYFVRKYQVDIAEMVYPTSIYKTFNDFFIREIDLTKRPVDPDEKSIVSPVDAKIIEFGKIKGDRAIQVKGVTYSILELIRMEEFSKRFVNGDFITLYLSPKDYHRIHSPVTGKVIANEYSRGHLYPVNDLGLYHFQNLFSSNERLTSYFQTDYGLIAAVKVGALNVGRLVTTHDPGWAKSDLKKGWLFRELESISYNKGEEFARFELGSTVILLFEPDKVLFYNEIHGDKQVKLGETLAYWK